MNVYLLSFLLFFLPFLILPFGISPFESGKIVIGEGCLFFFCLMHLHRSFFKHLWQTHRTLCILYGAIIVVTLVDLLFFRTATSFLGTLYRGQGILLLWLLLLFSLTSATVQLKIPPNLLKGLIVLHVLLSLFISPSIDGRFIGTLGEPNSFAGGMLFLWPFALIAHTKRNNVINPLLFVFVVFVIIGTGSRSGLIGLSLQLLFLLCYRYVQFSFSKSVLIVVLLLVTSLLLPFFDHTSDYESRSLIWQTALLAGVQSPIVGHGFGTMQTVCRR